MNMDRSRGLLRIADHNVLFHTEYKNEKIVDAAHYEEQESLNADDLPKARMIEGEMSLSMNEDVA